MGQGAADPGTDGFALVASHRAGPLLVLGPAGSGRTEALVARFVSLADEGVAPSRILVLTRTRAAGARLRLRLETALGRPYEELWAGTYEEICERLLREHPVEAGLDPFFGTLRPADRLAILLDLRSG